MNRIKETGSPPKEGAKVAHLLGVSLDKADGHKRLTRAEKFSVVGGSEETHGRMTETLIKTTEELKRKGRSLEEADPREIGDLIRKHSSS